jgi:hypothetical protein
MKNSYLEKTPKEETYSSQACHVCQPDQRALAVYVTPSVSRLNGIKWQYDWKMNWKGFGRKWPWHN